MSCESEYGGVMYVYVVRKEKVTNSPEIIFMGRSGGKSWKKGNITPLLLDRKDLKVER